MIFSCQRSDELAEKLRENWLNKPERREVLEPADTDDTLTNLSWLQSMSLAKNGLRINPPPSVLNSSNLVYSYQRHVYHSSPPKSHANPRGLKNILRQNTLSSTTNNNIVSINFRNTVVKEKNEEFSKVNSSVGDSLYCFDPNLKVISFNSLSNTEKTNYRTNFCTKPPFTYTTLIFMALDNLQVRKTTFADIITWICENFSYFKKSEISWQLDLRQCLTFSNCFQRVPKRKEEPHGYGDAWRLNPRLETITRSMIHPCTSETKNSPSQSDKKSSSSLPFALQCSSPELYFNGSETDNNNHILALSSSIDELVEETKCQNNSLSIDWWPSNEFTDSMNSILMNNSNRMSSPLPDEGLANSSSNQITSSNEKNGSLELMSDQNWTDEQLNLDELDNIFGLNNDI